MALAHKVDTDKIIREAQDPDWQKHMDKGDIYDVPYASRLDTQVVIPKYNLPKDGVDAKVAYQILHDELSLDGRPLLNLASFVHTWVPEECNKLMMENITKNLVDQDEYPAAQQVHERCVSMIAGLWNAPKQVQGENAATIGQATTGSSEAIMLGGLALKRRWQEKMKAAGKDIHNPGPNIVLGSEVQVANEKFARYFEVEARLVPVTKESNYVMDPKEAMKHVDENTIGVLLVLGSTYTGGFENVKVMSDLLDEYETKTGIHIPIHVDAASGGFIAPFVYPDLEWDFRLPRVQSINASGHKYGMTVVGVGWIVWRDASFLPKDMIFELHYLGETDYSYNLNFSRPAHPMLGQMFNFLNLGFNGYQRIISADLYKARILSRALEASGYYTCLSNIHRKRETNVVEKLKLAADSDSPMQYEEGLPVVAFRFSDEVRKNYPDVKQAWIQSQLRGHGWIVPNYALPKACEDIEILRVVVRESMGGDLLRRLVEDIITVTEGLLSSGGPSVAMTHAAHMDHSKTAAHKRRVADKHNWNDKGQTAHSHVC